MKKNKKVLFVYDEIIYRKCDSLSDLVTQCFLKGKIYTKPDFTSASQFYYDDF